MNYEAFNKAMSASRNGCNHFIRHGLVRSFAYSDGVEEVAEAGCYWLIDVLATELPAVFRCKESNPHGEHLATVTVNVVDSAATIVMEFEDDVPVWTKKIDYTDMPNGRYTFLMSNEQVGDTPFRLILAKEY